MEPPDPDSWLDEMRVRVAPLCDACVSETDVDGGGVALMSSTGVRTVVHTTDRVALALEHVQLDLGEGPSVDAVAASSPVLLDDVRHCSGRMATRWPFFLPQADALGVRGVFAFPLRAGSIALGSLELHRASAGPLAPQHLTTALRTADDIGSAVLDHHLSGLADSSPSPSLLGDEGPGRSVATVHQAAGMVMVQLDVSIDDAMARLRADAFAEGTSLIQLSADVVRGRRRFTKEQA
jgi:hypothetical protein